MRAILYHFAATHGQPGFSVEHERDEPITISTSEPGAPNRYLRPMLGMTLRVSPRPIDGLDKPNRAGGYRYVDIDPKNPEALGKTIVNLLEQLAAAGAPYATIVLSLDPDAHA